MKKILTFILAAVLAVSVTACGGEKDKELTEKSDTQVTDAGNNGENDKEPSSETIADNTDNNTEDAADGDNTEENSGESNGEIPENSEENNTENTENTENNEKEAPTEVTTTVSTMGIDLPNISAQTLIDTAQCKFTVTGIKDDSFFGPTLTVELENKSSDVDYVFNIRDSYINGVYTPMYLYSEVAAGKKSNEEISLSLDDLYKYGLEKLTDIEIELEVKDSNSSWIDPPAVLQTVSLRPYGKNAVSKFTIGNEHIKNVYIDNKYAKVSALGYYKNDMYGYCIDLFIENRADCDISVKFEDTSVNGKLLDPYVYEVVDEGKNSIARVDWPLSEFEANGLTTFEEIKFTLVIANNDDVSGKSYSSDEIVLSFV